MNKDVDKLGGRDFEDLIERLIKKMGFVMEERKHSADGGIDIKAYSEQPLLKGVYIIQCKRYSKPIGEPVIRDLYGVVSSEHANKGILITNSEFTHAAQNFARNKALELIDGTGLVTLLDKYLDEKTTKIDRSVRVSEGHIVTLEALRNSFEKIFDRKSKVSEGLIYINSRTFKNSTRYGEYAQDKLVKLSKLYQVLGRQLNYLNSVWQNSEGGIYSNLHDIKTNCREIINSLTTTEKDWEDLKAITPPRFFEESHAILCSFYDPIFDTFSKFKKDLAMIIENPSQFINSNDNNIKLTYVFSLDGKEKEYVEAMQKAVKKEKGGCFIATAIYQDPFSPELKVLYSLRDGTLRKTVLGRGFIRAYYFISPSVAAFIESSPLLNKFARLILDRLTSKLIESSSIASKDYHS